MGRGDLRSISCCRSCAIEIAGILNRFRRYSACTVLPLPGGPISMIVRAGCSWAAHGSAAMIRPVIAIVAVRVNLPLKGIPLINKQSLRSRMSLADAAIISTFTVGPTHRIGRPLLRARLGAAHALTNRGSAIRRNKYRTITFHCVDRAMNFLEQQDCACYNSCQDLPRKGTP